MPIPTASTASTALIERPSHASRRVRAVSAACALFTATLALSAEAGPSETIVVSATRTEAAAFDVPASIDRVEGTSIRESGPQVNVAESLGAIPGLLARDRQNQAQDVQVSVRGFGARSSFGIRGVRVYVDGIPATMPDGQGQLSSIDLGSVDHIEVLRGPYSALYGNSSGGVIQVFTEAGQGRPRVEGSLTAGSDGLARAGLKASGSSGSLGYLLSASTLETDGYRMHSAARRHQANAKLTGDFGPSTDWTLIANSVDLPKAQDPLGLTRAQFEGDPRAVDPVALTFDTRKTVDQRQLGASIRHRIDAAHALQVLVYGGQRSTVQFQAIPAATQANPLHAGGVIVLDRDYRGVDLRWTFKSTLAGRAVQLVAGLAHDTLDEHRRGHQNFIGNVLGVEGALRRDEVNTVRAVDPYAQAVWHLAPELSLSAGVRHSRIRFVSADRYVVGPNPDDSGSVTYGATLPVAAVMWALNDQLHLYATAGRGFETPTLNEIAYRSDGASGLNTALRAARSDNVEIGLKVKSASWGALNLAIFDVRTKDEIVTQTNAGGRSTFRNAGSTGRRGYEAAWRHDIGSDWRVQLALTWLSARYQASFLTCAATPCLTPNLLIAAGNRIPGVARTTQFAGLTWAPANGLRGALEVRAVGKVAVNDANSDAAPAYVTASASVGYERRWADWTLGGFTRIDNLSGRRFAGSVIVNEGNARYFEPGAGRTWSLGLSGALQF